MVTGRMGLEAILPLKLPVIIRIMLNFDCDGDRSGVGKCKHTFKEVAEHFDHWSLSYQIIITYLDTGVHLLDMAQGKLRAKVQLPKGAKQKGGNQKKRQGPKKGGNLLTYKFIPVTTHLVDDQHTQISDGQRCESAM